MDLTVSTFNLVKVKVVRKRDFSAWNIHCNDVGSPITSLEFALI